MIQRASCLSSIAAQAVLTLIGMSRYGPRAVLAVPRVLTCLIGEATWRWLVGLTSQVVIARCNNHFCTVCWDTAHGTT